MLLELPASVVAQMLYDEALLNKALERALTALTSSDHRYHTVLTLDNKTGRFLTKLNLKYTIMYTNLN